MSSRDKKVAVIPVAISADKQTFIYSEKVTRLSKEDGQNARRRRLSVLASLSRRRAPRARLHSPIFRSTAASCRRAASHRPLNKQKPPPQPLHQPWQHAPSGSTPVVIPALCQVGCRCLSTGYLFRRCIGQKHGRATLGAEFKFMNVTYGGHASLWPATSKGIPLWRPLTFNHCPPKRSHCPLESSAGAVHSAVFKAILVRTIHLQTSGLRCTQ